MTNPLDSQNNPTRVAVAEGTQPYEDTCVINFGGATSATCFFQQIPPGKRIVIQEFDAEGALETGLKPVEIRLITGSAIAGHKPHAFPTTFMGNRGIGNWFATRQETCLYVQGGETPVCDVGVSQT